MTDAVTVSNEKLAEIASRAYDRVLDGELPDLNPFAAVVREVRAALVSELQQRREREGWHDISTAPKDGTEILVFAETDEGVQIQQVVFWDAHSATGFPWCLHDGASYHADLFTHWRSLSTPTAASPTSPTEVKALREALDQIQVACLSEDDSAEDQLELVFGIASRALQEVRDER